MKITVVVDAKGTLVAAQQQNGQSKEAGLVAGPGQKVQELDLPLVAADFKDPQHFLAKVSPHIQGIRVQ